jgi:hypothetical protein
MITDVFTLKQLMYECATMGAMAAIQQIDPSYNDVDYTEACRIAGSRKWVDDRVKNKLLVPYRKTTGKNAKKYFSRKDIAALRAAEQLFQTGTDLIPK